MFDVCVLGEKGGGSKSSLQGKLQQLIPPLTSRLGALTTGAATTGSSAERARGPCCNAVFLGA